MWILILVWAVGLSIGLMVIESYDPKKDRTRKTKIHIPFFSANYRTQLEVIIVMV